MYMVNVDGKIWTYIHTYMVNNVDMYNMCFIAVISRAGN